ncbi:MAG: hypothetical protein ABI577_06055 [bacterium]
MTEETKELAIGTWVFTADGRELGRIKKLEDSAFLVDAPLAFDYWLERSLVAGVTEERVTLRIKNEELPAFKMDRPHDHNGFQEKLPDDVDPINVRDRAMLL